MYACYNAGGYTDMHEFAWLRQVLDVKPENMMTLAKVPKNVAEVDKLLAAAFRRGNWSLLTSPGTSTSW